MKRLKFAFSTSGGLTLVIASFLLPQSHLIGQTQYYKPCYMDVSDNGGTPCHQWNDIAGLCTKVGSPDGHCRVPSEVTVCYGWIVGENPTAGCGQVCITRIYQQTQTDLICEFRDRWETGTEVTADPSCTDNQSGQGCIGECLNRQTVENQTLHFNWFELFDCVGSPG